MVSKIVIFKAIPADSTIEIARTLRAKKKWKGDFICYFYSTGLDVNSIAWVETSYLSDSSKTNTKDRDGIPVKLNEILPGIVWFEDLLALTTDKFDRKDLIKEIPDVMGMVKYEVYGIPGKSDKGFFVRLRPDGSVIVVDLDIKDKNNIRRYIFRAPNVEGAFELDDTHITFYDTENSTNGRILSYPAK